jgi:hypothetical protein
LMIVAKIPQRFPRCRHHERRPFDFRRFALSGGAQILWCRLGLSNITPYILFYTLIDWTSFHSNIVLF